MNKTQFITTMDDKLRLIRTEYGLTQHNMALCLGISKKTLVEIEKRRKSLGWTGAVALASIFSNSTILCDTIGGDISSIIIAIAFNDVAVQYPKTWGGKVWWKTHVEEKGYCIQQNLLSKHYRLLNKENCRLYASFSLEKTEAVLNSVLNNNPLETSVKKSLNPSGILSYTDTTFE